MVACPRCKRDGPDDIRFCPFCRRKRADAPARARPLADLAPSLACPACGFENDASYRCCVQCGGWLEETEETDLRTAGAAPAAASRPPGRLLRLLPDGGVEEYLADGGRLEIGREPAGGEEAVRIDDDRFLSGRHAGLTRREGRYWLRDLDSTNGTFVRLRGEWELRPGDHILIGGSLFKYVV